MRKKTLVWLFIIGSVLFIIGLIVAGVGAASAAPAVQSAQAAGTTPQISSSSAGVALIGLVLYVIGLIVFAIGWIGALVATAKQGRWGWFVCIFLFNWIAELIYLIAGPGLPAKDSAPVMQG